MNRLRGMVLCIRMGVEEITDLNVEDCQSNSRLRKLAWCQRQIQDGERAFDHAGHAVVTVWETNGISICADCAERVTKLIRDNARVR